jgi:anti-sigma-K factor RskA
MAESNLHTNRFEELCSGYVLNALSPLEREEFEALLREADAEQRELYVELQSAANQLAFSIEPGEPAESVKAALLDSIQTMPGAEAAESEPADTLAPSEDADESTKYFGLAASFALLIISLSLLFYTFTLSSELGERQNLIENQQSRITALQNQLAQRNELLAILESRNIDMIVLAGMEANPNGYGKVIWDHQHDRALLQVSNLPPIPEDMQYQLWIIQGNRPISAGLFAIHDPRKDAFFKIEQMGPADEQAARAFAVTLEPKGGMPQPTGDMYLMGNIDGE